MTTTGRANPLLEIRDLGIEFKTMTGAVQVVEDVNLDVGPGEVVGLVGESGSGKSVTAQAIARLLRTPPARYTNGAIRLCGHEVLKLPGDRLRKIRGSCVAYIFQEPAASLNPVMTVGAQILESLRQHRPQAATREELVRLLRVVGIPAPERRIDDYPHQMSGGMQQRVMIAMALAPEPKLLVADEPTTALDATTQAQILDLLADLRRSLGMSILLITHNLGLLPGLADRVAVMYAGQIVETGSTDAILNHPAHPYTRGLIACSPRLGERTSRLPSIPGSVPSANAYPSGCRFHPRCALADARCASASPAMPGTAALNGTSARCWHPQDQPGSHSHFPSQPQPQSQSRVATDANAHRS